MCDNFHEQPCTLVLLGTLGILSHNVMYGNFAIYVCISTKMVFICRYIVHMLDHHGDTKQHQTPHW